jgi:poly(A) polymerase
MVDPIVVARSQHTISRRDIDPDALKVLYRLHQADHVAYLVGGSVRDLLLGRVPKDFDIGTSAHPYQVKKLFRNCWIIGRRFRLAHVKFGTKTIEVATFRRQVPAGSEAEPPIEHQHDAAGAIVPPNEGADTVADVRVEDRLPTHHHDNTFGTPEEDAFRRDFTVNALFYDIATFSLLDYTGGLEDLQRRLIRCIGDPEVRFQEDPVRMLRAVVLSARLDFEIDEPIYDAIRVHKAEIEKSAPARLLEEYYKILRSGHATRAFRALGETGLLRHISPQLPDRMPEELEASLDALDAYRTRFDHPPETLTNAVLLGTLIAPLGLMPRRARPRDEVAEHVRSLPQLGLLPLARKDVERLAHLQGLLPRLLDTEAPERRQHGVVRRPAFKDALNWMEIHGQSPDVVAYWREMAAEVESHRSHAFTTRERREPAAPEGQPDTLPPRRRRRRRRRGGRGRRGPGGE